MTTDRDAADERIRALEDEVRKLNDYVGLLRHQLDCFEEASHRRPLRVRVRARVKQVMGVRIGLLWHHPPKRVRIPARYFHPPRLPAPPAIAIATPAFNHGA